MIMIKFFFKENIYHWPIPTINVCLWSNTMNNTDGVFSALADVSRRDFMKLCTALAATMGLSSKAGAKMTAALTEPKRHQYYGLVRKNVRVVLNPCYARPTQQ